MWREGGRAGGAATAGAGGSEAIVWRRARRRRCTPLPARACSPPPRAPPSCEPLLCVVACGQGQSGMRRSWRRSEAPPSGVFGGAGAGHGERIAAPARRGSLELDLNQRGPRRERVLGGGGGRWGRRAADGMELAPARRPPPGRRPPPAPVGAPASHGARRRPHTASLPPQPQATAAAAPRAAALRPAPRATLAARSIIRPRVLARGPAASFATTVDVDATTTPPAKLFNTKRRSTASWT